MYRLCKQVIGVDLMGWRVLLADSLRRRGGVTAKRAQEIIDSVDDDFLIDLATTCSNRGVALQAEMQLRRRYPSRKAAKFVRLRSVRQNHLNAPPEQMTL